MSKNLTSKEKKRIKKILVYRIRGYSYHAIAKIFKRSRERIHQLVQKAESIDDEEIQYLLKETENTKSYLERDLKYEIQ